jgi:hypothetical protein
MSVSDLVHRLLEGGTRRKDTEENIHDLFVQETDPYTIPTCYGIRSANGFLKTSCIVFAYVRKEIFRCAERFGDKIYSSPGCTCRFQPIEGFVFTVNCEPSRYGRFKLSFDSVRNDASDHRQKL